MKRIAYFLLIILLAGCKSSVEKISDAEIIHQNVQRVTDLIVYDVFSPPVASRIYAYSTLAAFEAVRHNNPSKYPSLAENLNAFGKMPEPEKNLEYNFTLASTRAFFSVVRKMTFSVDSLVNYETRTYDYFRNLLDDSIYARSLHYGDQIANAVLLRANNDNYTKSRGKPKYLGSDLPGKWRPTPPDYFDGVEYCWGDMVSFTLDSSSQFAPPPPPPFSEDTASEFFRVNMEVYNISRSLTDEQKEIATYWDDNSLVMEHAGHMMFANKKISPGAHWIGIAEIASRKTNADEVKSAQAYALTAISIFDAFICCWAEKYRTGVIRPVTVIQEKIDPDWMPFLQTPPFPEYPSGHSTITRAAATILTRLFGDNFDFMDTSDFKYIGMKRNFPSFVAAADEASVSRVYGGIHYFHSVNAGADQGRKIGEHMIGKLKL